MVVAAFIAAFALIFTILVDAFEAVILPRRVTGRFRPTRTVYRLTWQLWSFIPRRIAASKARATSLSWYGPLSMFMLLGMWAGGLILGFGILQWALRSPISTSEHESGFFIDLYLSGTTFFTLGLGDVTPHGAVSRLLTIIEAGLGFGFLALVIGYLPVLYSAFSKREIQISMLDSRAGSPPTAAEIVARLGRARSLRQIERLFADWEIAGAETLETHISYPVLMFYRSHHDNQSWLASITAVLDTCALVLSVIEDIDPWQARTTFAMLRHCIVELTQLVHQKPRVISPGRLTPGGEDSLFDYLEESGITCCRAPDGRERLRRFRSMYEPYVAALANYLVLAAPPWHATGPVRENWKTSTFEQYHGEMPPISDTAAHSTHKDK